MLERKISEYIKSNYSSDNSICLLCSEPTPENCHRRLVANYFKEIFHEAQIIHLWKDDLIMKKEILIMTKSAKINGFCVAGIDISNGRWIRLVSDDKNGEGAVSRNDLTFQNGTQAEIFDLVSVECTPSPTKAQSENNLYDNNFYWIKIRTMS